MKEFIQYTTHKMKKQKIYEAKFELQYNKIYIARLKNITPVITVKILNDHKYDNCFIADIESSTDFTLHPENKIAKSNKNRNIEALKNDNRKNLIIIGVFFLHSCEKPNVFDEMKPLYDEFAKPLYTYYGENVKYFIEDLKGRIEIKLSDKCLMEYPLLVTGMVLGFVGFFDSLNIFCVNDIIFPSNYDDILLDKCYKLHSDIENISRKEIEALNSRTLQENNINENDVNKTDIKNLKIEDNKDERHEITSKNVDGINIKGDNYNILFISNILVDLKNNFHKLQVLLDYFEQIYSIIHPKQKIDEIIIFGNIFSNIEGDDLYKLIEKLSALFSLYRIKITLVPANGDPTTQILPQEKFHHKIFKNVHSVDNPSIYYIPSLKSNCILSSNTNIIDVLRYENRTLNKTAHELPILNILDDFVKNDTVTDDSFEKEKQKSVISKYFYNAMKVIINSECLCPSCPDTLKCVPYSEKNDPFFIGDKDISAFVCCAPFSNVLKVRDNLLFVLVPNFDITNEVLIVDIKCGMQKTIKFTQ
ncbi:hypothetical protein EDEG_02220 [Edhazardia aedis USNM 41457]|uniref:DNA polymerase alpha/delta/epsilon subunit B domain-containing protein n=1 Tax=Edhazardia aedis (strain USNM 41457) TaxID=1003232 RepID=J9DLI8_EDHAE|nr:hypothetical protein EDEG_02220 [Edhazardia aedis USNM 41457]|eukprot:EJW03455.1 hypothetical protein EDEG_02220 [Edhazardia aedis USNM 41457]